MNFLNGDRFYILLLLIPAVTALYAWAAARRKKLTARLLGKQAEAPQAVQVAGGKRFLRLVLFLAVLTCLVAAAARPWWGTRTIPTATSGRDILILFDVSKSMLATDVAPSRLAHARYLVRELATANKGDRFGLIAFAGNAFLACPLTSDTTGFLQYTDELGVHSVPLGGTHLERALQTASDAFQAAEGPYRAVVLITDGDELAGDSSKVLAAFKEKKIPLFIFGLGDPQVPALIPEGKGSYKRDSKGELVRTRLAEARLKQLALETGGIYVRSTAANSGLELVDRRIKSLAPRTGGTGTRSVPIERFPYMLAAALFLLAGYLIISERRLTAILLVCAFSLAAGEAPLPVPGKDTPGTAPTPAPAKELTDPVKLYNQALKLQQENKPGSGDLYARAIQHAGKTPEARSRSFFNLGAAKHGEAREALQRGQAAFQGQQLDAARQNLQKAKTRLGETGELYTQALTQSAGIPSAAGNLQKLADDLRLTEELLKKIEELEKLQQQAQQQTRQAKDQNQKPQNDPQDQQQNQKQMEQARQSAEKLQQQAREMKQQKMADNARNAAQDIQKAQQAKDRQERDQHLDDALKKLGGTGEKPQQQQQESPKQDQQKDAKEDPGKQSRRPQPRPQPAKLDKESAAKLLEAMANQEKELRDQLKERALQQQYKVEKDW